jgi:hypothetical protein
MDKFREINNKDEIIALMKKAPASNRGEVWQTLPSIRHHNRIRTLKDDEHNKAIVFESFNNYKFNCKYPVFIRINHRDLIFKLTARSFIIVGNKLACTYPVLAKAVEKRGHQRIPLPEDRVSSLVLKPMGAGAADLTVQLTDISKKGIGISISDMNRDYLIRNEHFKISSINGVYLAGNHLAELKYVEKLSKGVMKSGLQLQTPFDETFFDLICKIIFEA